MSDFSIFPELLSNQPSAVLASGDRDITTVRLAFAVLSTFVSLTSRLSPLQYCAGFRRDRTVCLLS